MTNIQETLPPTPIAHECDLCIIGGSCTGVFAAVRAARLGLSVALVERHALFGGMAVTAQVNDWHSLHDTSGKQQIIGGLTSDTLEKLRARNAVIDSASKHRGPHFIFNSAELALELDAYVLGEKRIRPFLQASCVAAMRRGDSIQAAIIEDKSGRRAIKARFFIDASGDGDLIRRAEFSTWKNTHLQPVTYQMMIAGLNRIMETTGQRIWPQVQQLAEKYNYPTENATPWINRYGGRDDLHNVYGPRMNDVDASDADQLTAALLESRRCHRALQDMIRERCGNDISPVSPAQALGVRETWHADCQHRLMVDEILSGLKPEDRIACGTYAVDVHSESGTILRLLNGQEIAVQKNGTKEVRRWRPKTVDNPACYYIPYRSLVPKESENLLICGRLIDADRDAFGAVRVMVNMNQTGEAAGTAAWLALQTECSAAEVNVRNLQKTLQENGSLLQ